MEKAESQGQRLSSYASSSSNKYSPKTPKKSTEKLSAHSTSKEESLSPHHLMSGYSFTSINSQSKDLNPECALKCTCNSSFNSLKSVKSSGGLGMLAGGGATEPAAAGNIEKTAKISKISCDAATSPNRLSNQKSLQPNLRLINSKKTTMCNELRISDDKKVTNKASLSPRRLITTRNAATSPHLEIRKHVNHELLPKSPEISGKVQLEKSNSLGESRPSRPLRTTRSLSPRPPVKHQHAIMVSDENDIVSVKVSPNDDFETDQSKQAIDAQRGVKKKHKAQSEQTSPNLSDYNTTFNYDKGANKSTSCLVYVPSDPWLKMSDVDGGGTSTLGKDEAKRRISKISQETRSLSRGNLEPLDAGDPWIWRKADTGQNQANLKRSPKQDIYRQTKSFSTTKFEIGDSNKQMSLVATDPSNSAKPLNRPKLQRCKSPLIGDDEKDTQISCTCNSTPTANDLKTPSASPGAHQPQQQQQARKDDHTVMQPSKTFLNVINPNLIQTRHSFSSISQKDDELQLNIRRLSEQIKHNTPRGGDVGPAVVNATATAPGGADFSEYLSQFRSMEAQKFAKSPKNASKKSESVLETTC